MKQDNKHLHRDTAVSMQAKELLNRSTYFPVRIEQYGGLLFQNNEISYLLSDNAEDIYKLQFEEVINPSYISECCHFTITLETSELVNQNPYIFN